MITVSVLKGSTGERYVGITNDLPRRLREHKGGRTKGGHVIGEFQVLLTEEYPDHATARIREKFLKSGQGREWLNTIEADTGSASGG